MRRRATLYDILSAMYLGTLWTIGFALGWLDRNYVGSIFLGSCSLLTFGYVVLALCFGLRRPSAYERYVGRPFALAIPISMGVLFWQYLLWEGWVLPAAPLIAKMGAAVIPGAAAIGAIIYAASRARRKNETLDEYRRRTGFTGREAD